MLSAGFGSINLMRADFDWVPSGLPNGSQTDSPCLARSPSCESLCVPLEVAFRERLAVRLG
jgi:hypothetical protein